MIAWAAACAVCLAAAVFALDALRRVGEDRAAGRRTPGALLGRTGMRVVYSVLIVVAYVMLPLAWALEALPIGGLLPYATAPLAIRLGDTVSHREGAPLDGALRGTVALAVAFLALLVLGSLIPDL